MLLQRVFSDERAVKRWSEVKALVMDEISMIDGELFENIEYIARVVRYEFTDEVWGGIQLVVSGDFLQLPPIVDQRQSCGKHFAFEADCWNASFDLEVELTNIFRQSDPHLIKLLQGIRRGESNPDDLKLLVHRCSKAKPDPSAVQLYPRNEDVNRVNANRMKSLEEESIVYTAVDSGKNPWKSQLEQGLAPTHLEVCEGARVMLIKNIDIKLKLVNGATGTIIGFSKPEKKSVLNLSPKDLLPIVKFDSGKTVVIEPETWDVTEGDLVVATRKQIPLVLAWALSIHKCQGMTLDRLHTDLSRAFGCGMVYVALSRVRSLEGLHLSGFRSSKIIAHPKVLQYYQRFG
ncbi:hypothetical protein L1049_023978 [Liquidambar formosana]|uniref:ATP-dependent DNA helicase n=1 Tax=Liquidambar formosana TaxID=63359 RepID=A0AAP0X0Y6_LIQFO